MIENLVDLHVHLPQVCVLIHACMFTLEMHMPQWQLLEKGLHLKMNRQIKV